MKVLIVEDDFVSRRMMQKFLDPYGETHVAVNGAEALTAFRAALKEGAPYDLICLDIMMPYLNGREVLETIRGLEAGNGTGSVKVLMTSALQDSENVLGAFNAQADGYLVKPIEKGVLVEEIRKLGLLDQTSDS